MRLRPRSLAVAIAGALLGAASAVAQEPVDETARGVTEAPLDGAGSEAEEPAAPAGDTDFDAYWSQRLERAASHLTLAREKAEEAEAAYSRARHDKYPRGEAMEKIKQRHFAAERELREAEAALPRLVEQARRAGVAPEILREYWDDDPADEAS